MQSHNCAYLDTGDLCRSSGTHCQYKLRSVSDYDAHTNGPLFCGKDQIVNPQKIPVLCNGCHPKPCRGCKLENDDCKIRILVKGEHSCSHFVKSEDDPYENLKAELAHEKASRKDTEEEYRGKLATVIQDNANMRLERIFALKTIRGLENQNAALRAALREVL